MHIAGFLRQVSLLRIIVFIFNIRICSDMKIHGVEGPTLHRNLLCWLLPFIHSLSPGRASLGIISVTWGTSQCSLQKHTGCMPTLQMWLGEVMNHQICLPGNSYAATVPMALPYHMSGRTQEERSVCLNMVPSHDKEKTTNFTTWIIPDWSLISGRLSRYQCSGWDYGPFLALP